MTAASATRWGSMMDLFLYFTRLSRPGLLHPIIRTNTFVAHMDFFDLNSGTVANLCFGPDQRKQTKDFPGVQKHPDKEGDLYP